MPRRCASLAKIATIRPGEVYRYIDSHPAKFSKREFLTVDQISLSMAAYTQPVIDATKDLKSIIEVDQKLIAMGVIHTSSIGVLNSGDLPEELFKALHAKNGSDVFFVRAGLSGVFFVPPFPVVIFPAPPPLALQILALFALFLMKIALPAVAEAPPTHRLLQARRSEL
jgi:hypothetical protein